MLAFATAWTPTASGSVSAACSGGEPVGHLKQQRLAEQHALGIAADVFVGIADALRSLRRQQRRQRADARAWLQLALRARAVIEDFAAEFMAEHDVAGEVHRFAAGKCRANLDHAVGVLARVQVGAADAAGQRLDQHLPDAGHGLGQLVDDDLAVPENGSAQLVVLRYCCSEPGDKPRNASDRFVELRQAFGDSSPSMASSCERLTRSRWAV